MKHIEQLKSIVLLLLVLLSLAFTFLIWTYTPKLQIIEESEVEQTMIGKQKEIKDVLKPTRIIIRENGQWLGTRDTFQIDWIMSNLSNWKSTELTSIQRDYLTDREINELVRRNGRMTMFFPDEIPINTYSSILSFTQIELPEMTFNKLIVEKVSNNTVQIHFVSERNRTHYHTHVTVPESISFSDKESFPNLIAYEEITRAGQLSLYVPKEQVELEKYTYIIDEISQEELKEALFTDPTIVQKNIGRNKEAIKYNDAMNLMEIDPTTKQIEYVYLRTESFASIPASRLLNDSFEFINEHGGFTDDFRFTSMDVLKHITEYQLFKNGHPVFSSITSTHTYISTTWGEKRISQYKRPYYKLDPGEKSNYRLPSGIDIVKMINQSDLQLDEVKEIILGYYLIRNEDKRLYTLEPSWFVILHDGSWRKLTSDSMGGTDHGLE